MQSIEQIQAAVVNAFPNATPQEQGTAIAAIIESLNTPTIAPAKAPARKRTPKAVAKVEAVATPAPARKAQAPAKAKPQAKAGRTLDTAPGSITPAQFRRISGFEADNGFESQVSRKWSMATASKYYAELRAAA